MFRLIFEPSSGVYNTRILKAVSTDPLLSINYIKNILVINAMNKGKDKTI
jgi:hypothetical protein